MDIDIASYKALFLQTANENLSGITDGIALLEKNPEDTDAVESIFIKSHSLKGQSMTMGYTGIAKTSLAIECYMRSVRDEHREITVEAVRALREATEKIHDSLAGVEKQNVEAPMSEVITTLEQTLGVTV